VGALLQSKPIDVDVKKDESADVLAIRNTTAMLSHMLSNATRVIVAIEDSSVTVDVRGAMAIAVLMAPGVKVTGNNYGCSNRGYQTIYVNPSWTFY
jgi:hypothetical protein